MLLRLPFPSHRYNWQRGSRALSTVAGLASFAVAATATAHAQTFTAVAYPTYSTSFLLVTPSVANPIDLTVNSTSSEQADSGTQGNFLVFNEKTATLTAPLAVDLSAPKAAGTTGTAGTIPTGTLVSSLYFHYDGPGTASSPYGLIITFDKPVVGLEVATDKSGSGSIFAIPGVTGYNTNGTEATDINGFAFSGNQLVLRGTTTGGADDIRVLLNAGAPEPGALAFFAMGFVGTGTVILRRAKNAVATRSTL